MKNAILNTSIVIFSTLFVLCAVILSTQNFSANRHPKKEFPYVHRYNSNVNKTSVSYGDLIAMSFNDINKEYLREITFWTDDYGFINPPIYSDSDTFDIITVGDSYTASSSISQDKQWPNLLRNNNKKVYNLGHPAESPWHQYANVYLEKGRINTHKNSILIWQLFQGNDLDDTYLSLNIDSLITSGQKTSMMEKTKIWINNSILGELKTSMMEKSKIWIKNSILWDFLNRKEASCNKYNVYRVNDSLGEMYFLNWYIENSKKTYSELKKHENYEKLSLVIAQMNKFVGKNLRIILLPIPSKAEIYHWRLPSEESQKIYLNKFSFNKIICEIASSNNIECIDVSDVFYKKAIELSKNKQFLWWKDDTHLNELGNKLLSELIISYLNK